MVGCIDPGVCGVAFEEAHCLVLLEGGGLGAGVDVELVPPCAFVVGEVADVGEFIWEGLGADYELLID